MKTVTMPADPPLDLQLRDRNLPVDPFDEVLFDLCRDDDYAGLYREFVKRYGQLGTDGQAEGDMLIFQGRDRAEYSAWLDAVKRVYGEARVFEVSRGLVRLLPIKPSPRR